MDNFDLSPETQAELQGAVRQLVKAFDEIFEVLTRIVEEIMERIRQIAGELGRFFLKQQLLEWRIPYPIADFIAKKTYWYWAWVLGARWLNNKLSALE